MVVRWEVNMWKLSKQTKVNRKYFLFSNFHSPSPLQTKPSLKESMPLTPSFS